MSLLKKSNKIKNPKTFLFFIPTQNSTLFFFPKGLTNLELEMFTGSFPRGRQKNYFYWKKYYLTNYPESMQEILLFSDWYTNWMSIVLCEKTQTRLFHINTCSICSNTAGVAIAAGASSIIFWCLRCTEQSRPNKEIALPYWSANICTSRWRDCLASLITNIGDPGTSAWTCIRKWNKTFF